MAKFLEKRYEVTTTSRLVDVRPFGVKAAEWLATPFAFVFCSIPLALIPVLAPVLLVPCLVTFLVIAGVYALNKPLLPLRYPAMAPKRAPGGKADGILMFGNVRSTSPYEMFKEAWLADDDLRKHFLIIGSTGSGKSETLKGILFNALCWSSGYFVADGKADNKLPTDNYIMVRSVGRDDDLLILNFLLGGSTPQQVANSRRRRTNGTNPFSSADADTIIQMGSNMLPKVEGEGKNWQEKALNFWRALVVALCYKRDTQGMELSVSTFIDYMGLPKVEELYLEGLDESKANGDDWSYGYVGIKAYLESGCPAYKIEKLQAKHAAGGANATPPGGMRPGAAPGGKAFEQDNMAYEQHAYRTSQLMPVLNLLDKTYGFIFRDKFPEIDMIDVTLNNRILLMLIPSLEKSAAEAENLGKLAIACLRVMMGKNLGAHVEGTRRELLESKATNAPYPYIVALDELAYYFSDGIAVMCAQARSLGFSMMALCQDLEKLTEGARASEAGAMMANQVSKYFMRIDDAKKTWEMVREVVGKTTVAVYKNYEIGAGGWSRRAEVDLQEIDRVNLNELQSMKAGQGVLNSCGETMRLSSFYMGKDLEKHKVDSFHINRFLQVRSPTIDEISALATSLDQIEDKLARGERRLKILRGQVNVDHSTPKDEILAALGEFAKKIPPGIPAPERGIALYMYLRNLLDELGMIGGREEVGLVAAGAANEREAAPTSDALVEPSDMDSAPIIRAENGDEPIEEDDSESEDLLGFLNPPFIRKPLESVVGARKSAEPKPEFIKSESLVPDRPFQETETDIVKRIIARGRSVNLVKIEEPDALPSRLLSSRIEGVGNPSVDETPSDDWVEQSIIASRNGLADLAGADQKVVGFTDPVLEKVGEIEELLGNSRPQEAAKTLEQVVAAKVTPVTTHSDEMSLEEIDAIFSSLSQLPPRN